MAESQAARVARDAATEAAVMGGGQGRSLVTKLAAAQECSGALTALVDAGTAEPRAAITMSGLRRPRQGGCSLGRTATDAAAHKAHDCSGGASSTAWRL